MTTRTDTQGSTKLADADVDELTKLGSSVGELERDAMAQSWNLRALGKIVIQASRRADAYARLDAALGSPHVTAQQADHCQPPLR